MDTAMISKRGFAPNSSSSKTTPSKATEKNWHLISVYGLIGGFVVMLLGMVVGVGVLAAIGFLAFVMSFMYLNSMFWARKFDEGKIKLDRSNRTYWT